LSTSTFSSQLRSTGRAPHRNAFWRERISRYYAADIVGAITRDMLVVLTAVEAIFLSEYLISHLLPLVLEYGGSLTDALGLSVFAIPSGLYLALPLALLVSVYLVLLRRREASEFTVLAGMGYGGRVLIGLVLLVSFASFVLASLLAGYVEPHARYQLRKGIFDAAIEELRSGEIAAGKFHVFGDMAVFASRGRLGDRASGVFVHEHLEGNRNRIVMAERSLGLTSSAGRKAILLDDARILTFTLEERGASCEGCVPAPRLTPANVVNLNRFFVGAPELPLPQASPRGTGQSDERMTTELIAQDVAGNAAGILGNRMLRAALCFLAPLLALAALAATGQRTLLLALPGACALLLGGTFFGPRLVDRLAVLGTPATIAIITLLTVVIAAAAIAVVRWREAKLLAPARVRM
jgi:lipopolysaccharide export LptBFGC system permease protein LptF